MKTKSMLPANQQAASESRSLKLNAFVVHFKRLDLGPPTGGCLNQIVQIAFLNIYSKTYWMILDISLMSCNFKHGVTWMGICMVMICR